MFEGKKILITGGTGSLGQALTKRLLESKVDTIRIFSRNENKQVRMDSQFKDDRLRFLIGDVRDLPRLQKAFEDIDFIFHAAALKHVPVIEYNPFEAVKTNVVGSQNVIDAALKENIEKAICIGTDKAVSPLNTYGATKLLMEKLFVTANPYKIKQHQTKFIAVRYGNVLGSSGSVAPIFIEQMLAKKKITVTDLNMTRFSITMQEALDFIMSSIEDGKTSEVFIPKLRSYTLKDLKQALSELIGFHGEEIMPIRSGEKMHETLINSDEIRYTWEYNNKYVIFNPQRKKEEIEQTYSGIKKASFSNAYSSDKVEKIPIEELKTILINSGLINSK